jgi:hypothetical protein
VQATVHFGFDIDGWFVFRHHLSRGERSHERRAKAAKEREDSRKRQGGNTHRPHPRPLTFTGAS